MLSVEFISCSKERKCQAIHKYWSQKGHDYYVCFDDALETDSQDERDHTCRPTDPQVVISSSHKKGEH